MHFTIWNHNGQVEELIDALAAAEEREQTLVECIADLVTNDYCACRKTEDRCPRCRLAIEEAYATLRAIPAEKERA